MEGIYCYWLLALSH